jgi:SSS family solute:Na+ symporter
MIVGFAMGVFRMLVDTPVTLGLAGFENGYTPGTFLWICNNIYFQYFSVLITIVSALVMVGVSLATAEPDYVRIESLTFETATEEDRQRRGELALERCLRLGLRAVLHPRRVPVLPRLT